MTESKTEERHESANRSQRTRRVVFSRLTKHDHEGDSESPDESNHDPRDLKTELSEVPIEPTCKNNSLRGQSKSRERAEEREAERTSRDSSIRIVVGDGSLREDTSEKSSDDSGKGVT